MEKHFNLVVISSFTADLLKKHLVNNKFNIDLNVKTNVYDQVYQILSDTDNKIHNNNDFALIWTLPEKIFRSYQKLIEGIEFSEEELLREVDEFCELIKNINMKYDHLFLPLWGSSTFDRGKDFNNLNPKIGNRYWLYQINIRLINNLYNQQNILILDSDQWFEFTTQQDFNLKYWYMGKVLYDEVVYSRAAEDILSYINILNGYVKKIILLDLDNTLWGGIVGDIGYENLNLGGHDPIGEAFKDFQYGLRILKNRGFLLAIISKNEESVALSAIENHPEMFLKIEDFVSWRINWDDKAQNILEIMNELNLGLDSAVFIDDNPRERSRVKEALPDVFVPNWPEDPLLFRQTLLNLHCFDKKEITDEDKKRTSMYKKDLERKDNKKLFKTQKDWLKELDIQVVVKMLDNNDLKRVTQLFNKTNQMNLSTRRLNEKDLLDWTRNKNVEFFTFRVSDKFGDLGLTGIASISIDNSKRVGLIIDFILSCRAFGRNIEDAMLFVITSFAKERELDKLEAMYLPTKKNKPMFLFLQRIAIHDEENRFFWDLNTEILKPEHITLLYK